MILNTSKNQVAFNILLAIVCSFFLLNFSSLTESNSSEISPKIEAIKTRCYELLIEQKYEEFLELVEEGILQALEIEDRIGHLHMLTFKAEFHMMRDQCRQAIPTYRTIVDNSDDSFEEYLTVLNNLAHCYRKISNYDSAFIFVNDAITLQKVPTIRRLKSYFYKGSIYKSIGSYGKAIQYTMMGLENVDSLAASENYSDLFLDMHKSTLWTDLGDLFLLIGDINSSKEYLIKAARTTKKNNLEILYSEITRLLGHNYLSEMKYDSAIYTYNKVENLIEKGILSDKGKFLRTQDLLLANIRKGDLAKAAVLYNTMNFAVDKNPILALETSYYPVAAEYQLANENPLRSLKLLEEYNHKFTGRKKLEYYSLRHKTLRSLGRTEQAYLALEKYYLVKDSLINFQKNQMIYNLEGRYQKAEQSLAIAELNLLNKSKSEQLSRQQRTILLGGLSLIGLIGLSILGFSLYRTKQKATRQLKGKNKIISKSLSDKELLLKEIHHRVKNNLQVISSLLSLQSDHIKDETALNAIQEGRNRVKSMAIIHQNLYQEDNLTGIQVKDYFEKLARSLFNSYNVKHGEIELELNVEAINLDVDTVIPIGLILNELITNSLKYAFPADRKGKISISMLEEDNLLILKVEDNGVGFDSSNIREESTSFGYQIIHAFRDKLDAELKIESINGTKVEIGIADYLKAS